MTAIASGDRREPRRHWAITAGLRAVLERGLSPEREARFASMSDLLAELASSLGEQDQDVWDSPRA